MNYWIWGGIGLIVVGLGWVYWAIRDWEDKGGL
jgi:hypothetical protein